MDFRSRRNCTIHVAKTKALISCAVTVQLICAFISHMQKSGFLMMHSYIYRRKLGIWVLFAMAL